MIIPTHRKNENLIVNKGRVIINFKYGRNRKKFIIIGGRDLKLKVIVLTFLSKNHI